ncbi:MAG: hypothetical protein KGL95_11360, partial [Patescibacteria group bacterium]|nr:hypothetical protein [Patescibacteria group bacterium]
FTLSGVTLPDKAIVSVAYNTTHYGYSPIGQSAPCYTSSAGCGYDSLNVALTAPPSVGSDPVADSAYLYSTWTGAYCDNGTSGTGTFRLDSPCWAGYQPAIEVTASLPSPTSMNQCKDGGWQNYQDANSNSFKNQGDCVSYVQSNPNAVGNKSK